MGYYAEMLRVSWVMESCSLKVCLYCYKLKLMITRLSFLECFTKHGYFTMHRLLWSKELLNYTVPFICHFGKTKRVCMVISIASNGGLAVLQKVEPDIGFFEVACWRWFINWSLKDIIWKALIRAENSVVNLDNCPSQLSAFCRSLLSIYLQCIYMYMCVRRFGDTVILLSYVCANVL